jgi:hypothetical protein
MKKWIHSFLELSFFCSLFIPSITHAQDGSIDLVASDDVVVSFPSYLGTVSHTIRDVLEDIPAGPTPEPIPVTKYPSSLLQLLSQLVKQLPSAARDIHGQQVSAQNINPQTIFVNSLVKQASQPTISNVSNVDNPTLGKLYDAAFYFNIQPLINLFASTIADRIYPVSSATSLEELNTLLVQHGFGDMPHEYLIREIKKYLRLKELRVPELTVADYIGLKGQPKNLNSG